VSDERPKDLPAQLWDRVGAASAGDAETTEAVVAELVGWAQGRHPDRLEDLLDGLRARGAYPISLGVLEAAWNSDLPPERMGRVVEDWIGTVKFGLGDDPGAETVARHICDDAERHGPAFVGDLGHLLLGWEMYALASPLVEAAAEAMPGDLSVQFNLGVVRKLQGDWAASRHAFETVLRHRREDQASRWNLGIACTALGDWAGARLAWTELGMALPPGDGDFGAEGEITAIRLPFDDGEGGHEVVWGRRMGPARARLRTIPRFSKLASYGDVVLLDGVTHGETQLNGEAVAVFPALARLQAHGAEVMVFYGEGGSTDTHRHADVLVERLNREGWPAANWSSLGAGDGVCIAVAIEPNRSVEEGAQWVARWSGELELVLQLEPLP
jgi:hypothetical protein